VCLRLERIKAFLKLWSPEPIEKIASAVLSIDQLNGSARHFSLRNAAGRTEHHLQIMKSHQPSGWNPELVVEGRDYLEEALARGAGAVLWVAHFCFNALATKKALAQTGFKIWHMSRPEHGFSKSRFGIKVLNPVRVRAELPHLAGRIVINRGNPTKAKKSAEQLLRGNNIVSITAGAWEGRRIATVKLFNGTIELATGAPALADCCNAVLLPVFTVRDRGQIRIIIDRPIDIPANPDAMARLALMSQEFCNRLQPHVLSYPDQWRDWKKLKIAANTTHRELSAQ
jgi:lauroyl/myristoyl acyltransferase